MPTKKEIITKKGRFADKRSRFVIQYYENGKKKIIALPKPEDLRKMMETHKRLNLMREEEDTFK